ncbi:uncharacterized protein PHACADRAFT_251418 [Phanerochaete carnosa HHB-10118-sp]|uniref:Uncharacterized protein n=1 Tax=Phanerochaete carnosa (strain HHB-10118-sp) TaxID=650164 RepID=K5X495_PHACS|nr:uncharacterized protein PHACADRAFT_251418 [Phanerochaete carnosa HHB-10118-sp]EKM57657.1 hypothetical protein PHACADRAFT_251418 [Phanerochaete carnosa HHB-10118-sp]
MSDILSIVGFALTAVFSSLRVFAICNRSHFLSLSVFALSMVPFVLNLVNFTKSQYMSISAPFFGIECVGETSLSARTLTMFVWTIRVSLVLADAIVLISTWTRTFGHWRQARRADVSVSLTACLLRDGTVYFVILLAINITQLATVNTTADVAPLTPFITIVPLVLINRFMINLRTVDTDQSETSDKSSLDHGLSTPHFRRSTDFLGNLGETLHDGWDGNLQGDSLSGGDDAYSGESYALSERAVHME